METSTEGGGIGWTTLADRFVSLARGPHAEMASDPGAYRLLVASLFSSPTSLVLSNSVGALVPVFCWFASGADVFLYFAAAAALIIVVRTGTLIRFARVRDREMSTLSVWKWDREYFLGATAFSVVLGFANFVALAWTDNVPCHIITIVCGIAFSSGYVARNSGRPFFVIVQLVCFCLPMALGLAIATDPFYEIISLYIILFAVTNVSIVFSLNRNLLRLAAATKQSELLAQSLRHKNVTLDSALNSMTHGLCLFNRDLRLEVANSRFLELYGLATSDAVPGTPLREITGRLVEAQILAPALASDLEQLCARAATLSSSGEREMQVESGQIFVVTVDTTDDGGILVLTEDASARKEAAAQIEQMARCDTLTGLPNRFRFNELLRGQLETALSDGDDVALALFYVDLDDFKIVNDTMGHEAGDHLLVQVAARLTRVVGASGVVGRFGGDEFLVLYETRSDEAALALGRAVTVALAEPFDVEGTAVSITTSVGIALGPRHGGEPGELLRAADMALYSAKAAGRNNATVYTPAMSDALSHRRAMEVDLRQAVRSGRLALHYQPIVDARTDQVRSYEALMRWHHPEKGMISPAEFIPIAEQTGLIVQMGAWALRQACADAKSWPEGVSVAVNVSAFQFKDSARLIESVKDALLITGLNPSRLELEVTESLLIVDQDATLEAIRALRRLGVRFSLDDFGTGYSSLAYLARYPFSKVKIDRSFAEHLTSDSPSRSIIEVVCQLAAKLGMRVVVEGIETEEQRREIVSLGAEQAQGWLFGRPQPSSAIGRPRQDAA